jgi:cobalt transport protein ATP-binding subunit
MIPAPASDQGEDRIVSVTNLKFTYEGGIEAVKDLTLNIRRGDYVAIVGGNGSGKTTLAKNMNGLLRPGRGTIVIRGKDATKMAVPEIAKIVGYAFQNPDHQLFCTTVEEEVRFGPLNLGYSDSDVGKKVEKALDAMNLKHLRAKPPLTLRLGERRRVSLASVIAMDPDVFILDEPTTGLDTEESEMLMQKLRLLNAEGKTIVLITHDMRLVSEHAKRVVVMSEGRIILDSDPRGAFSDLDILRRSNLEPPAVTKLAHALKDKGIPTDIISPEELVLHLLRGGGT